MVHNVSLNLVSFRWRTFANESMLWILQVVFKDWFGLLIMREALIFLNYVNIPQHRMITLGIKHQKESHKLPRGTSKSVCHRT